MKKLIDSLEKARKRYKDKHGVEPSVFGYDSEEGLLLCYRVISRRSGITTAKKPYMYFKSAQIKKVFS